MAHNRIREFRKAKGLTLDQLAEATGISQGHLSRLEKNRRMLMVPVAEKIAGALQVRTTDLLGLDIDDAAMGAVGHRGGFSDDLAPYHAKPGDPIAALATEHEYMFVVNSDAVSRLGIQRGDVVKIDVGDAATKNVAPLKIVQVRLHPEENFMAPVTLIRQFVPPRLLITNSAHDNLPSIDMDQEDAHIVGVVTGTYRSFT